MSGRIELDNDVFAYGKNNSKFPFFLGNDIYMVSRTYYKAFYKFDYFPDYIVAEGREGFDLYSRRDVQSYDLDKKDNWIDIRLMVGFDSADVIEKFLINGIAKVVRSINSKKYAVGIQNSSVGNTHTCLVDMLGNMLTTPEHNMRIDILSDNKYVLYNSRGLGKVKGIGNSLDIAGRFKGVFFINFGVYACQSLSDIWCLYNFETGEKTEYIYRSCDYGYKANIATCTRKNNKQDIVLLRDFRVIYDVEMKDSVAWFREDGHIYSYDTASKGSEIQQVPLPVAKSLGCPFLN